MSEIRRPDLQIDIPPHRSVTAGGGSFSFQHDQGIHYAWREDVFSPLECDAIREIGRRLTLQKARTVGILQSDEIRKSQAEFFFPNEHTEWIFDRIARHVLEMNDQFFRFDLTGFDHGIQFTRYEAPGAHYDWHIDRGQNMPSRKMSLVVQLSDPADYKGGALQFWMGGKQKDRAPVKQGSLVIFPSFVFHRVKPVKEGVRESLVAWLGGPAFR